MKEEHGCYWGGISKDGKTKGVRGRGEAVEEEAEAGPSRLKCEFSLFEVFRRLTEVS